MADGLSVWLARRSGITCRTACGIRLLAETFSDNQFQFQTFLFATYWCIQRIGGFTTMRYINRLFTYLLTSLLIGHERRSNSQPLCRWWRRGDGGLTGLPARTGSALSVSRLPVTWLMPAVGRPVPPAAVESSTGDTMLLGTRPRRPPSSPT